MMSRSSVSKTSAGILKNRHSPTLDSILMVEDTLREHRVISKTQLWKKLPKAMQYGTLTTVLDYLETSKKISMTARQCSGYSLTRNWMPWMMRL